MHLFRRFYFASALIAGLQGCGIQNPALDTFMYVLPTHRQYAEVKPGVEYLRVDLDGRVALMALGSREVKGLKPHEQITERWYNAQGEMLVLKNGRIQEVIGMTREWRHQESSPPSWADVSAAQFREEWVRQIDAMPGYQYGQIDQIVTGMIGPIKVADLDISNQAQWFADVVTSKTSRGEAWWYLQKFAVLDGRVIYSEQCIAEGVCFKLKPMGVVAEK